MHPFDQPLLDDDAPAEFAEPDHLTEGEIAGLIGKSLLVDDEPEPDDIDDVMRTLTPEQRETRQPAGFQPIGAVAAALDLALVHGEDDPIHLAEPEPAPETALEQQQLTLTEQAERLQITDPATFRQAEELLRTLAAFEDRVTEFFAEDIANAYRTWNTLTSKRKKQLDPIEAARNTLAARYAAFDRAEKARAEEERKRREAEALLEQRNRLAAEAAQLEQQSEEAADPRQADRLAEEAAQVRHEAATAPAPYIPAQRTVAPSKGISAREKWAFEVTDKLAIVKEVAAGRLSLEAVEVNGTYFRGRATTDKGTATIPGVRFFDAGSVAVRRK